MADEDKQEEAKEEPSPAAAGAEDEEPGDVEGLRARLKEETEKAQSHHANWQRAAADYQNLKRRMEQERSEVGRLATASLIINLLSLMDDLDRALHTVDTKLAGLTWIDGIWLIYRKFQAVLENAGVKEIEADSQQFDPRVHEAISEAPGEEGRVLSVVQRGYQLGDRVIRPAMVIVGKKDEAEEEKPEGEGETEDKKADVEGEQGEEDTAS